MARFVINPAMLIPQLLDLDQACFRQRHTGGARAQPGGAQPSTGSEARHDMMGWTPLDGIDVPK